MKYEMHQVDEIEISLKHKRGLWECKCACVCVRVRVVWLGSLALVKNHF